MSRIIFQSLLTGLCFMLLLSGCQQANNAQANDSSVPEIELTAAELNWIGDQIFRNECASREACLVHWNEGEAFPSLGIGHFIWYPQGVDEPFVESFPAMIEYLSAQGAVLPDWLARLDPLDAPWATREAFLNASDSEEGREQIREQIQELRDFLVATKGLQASFIAQRAKEALGRVIAAAPEADQKAVSRRIRALTDTPGGTYALIDYVNFKGEGLVASERYNGQGWGLLQVLQAMDDSQEKPALIAFRESAGRMLTRRAENAERDIERERWLPGWLNRLNTYREPDAGR